MHKRSFYKSSQMGFTLMEMLFVLAIVGLLAAIVLFSVVKSKQQAEFARVMDDLKQIELAIDNYASEAGVYPCFDHSDTDTKEAEWSAPYLASWPKNPWGIWTYHWEDGHYDATPNPDHYYQSIGVEFPDAASMAAFEAKYDDGDLAIGVGRMWASPHDPAGTNRLHYEINDLQMLAHIAPTNNHCP